MEVHINIYVSDPLCFRADKLISNCIYGLLCGTISIVVPDTPGEQVPQGICL